MELGSIIGIIMCFGGVAGGYVLEIMKNAKELGMDPGFALQHALSKIIQFSAMFIIFGGTIGATITSVPFTLTKQILSVLKKAFMVQSSDPQEIIERIIKYVNISRTNGIIALDTELKEEPNDFLREGIQMVVDGQEINVVKDYLRTKMDFMAERHENGAKFFNNMGGFFPTFGIIGTVMGLIMVLSSAGENPSDPGPLIGGIAVAFVATFYGVLFANATALPIGSKLKMLSQEEMLMQEMMLEGILSLQAAENPRIVREKLNAFLSPKERHGAERAQERG